jgi:hypothetical protein
MLLGNFFWLKCDAALIAALVVKQAFMSQSV